MKASTLLSSVLVPLVGLTVGFGDKSALPDNVPIVSVATGDAQTGPVECVRRKTDRQPPRATLPLRRAFRGKQGKFPGSRKLKPLCPEGEVPVLAVRVEQRFPKGNPLIGNFAAPEKPGFPTGEFIIRNLLLPFDQVYWKREHSASPPHPSSMSASGDAPCDGTIVSGDCFYYASAGEQRTADGGGMTFTIEDPTVDNSGDAGGHSIGEIAVQGGPSNGDDVEMGFSVSPDQWRDTQPHLFIYHWINWNQTCYNTCGWNQYSNTYVPGMDLTQLVGQDVYIGWVHYQSAWWGWFNDQWLGYVKDSEWNDAFTQNTLIQWYGEVESNNGIPPKTQMGNGQFPSQSTAATMATLCDVDAKAWICFYRDLQNVGATRINYYDVLNHTAFGAVRYGGPGQ